MDTTSKYLLRWRGRQQGPFSLDQIEHLLATNKIGMFHEVFVDGRWLTLDTANLLQPAPAAVPTAPASPQPNTPAAAAGTVSTEDTLALRWSGKSMGMVGVVELERRLDRQEISMLHEVFFERQWTTLGDYFVRRNFLAARRINSRPAAPAMAAPSAKRGGRIVLEKVGRTLKNGERILKEISLVIEPDEFVALLGPSGSGKSTLLNAMTGRHRATEGLITINGEDFYRHSWKFREQIGHVPQKDIVHLPLNVCQELTFAARLRLSSSKSRVEITERVGSVIEQIGLQDRKRIRNANLSGGQVKRVSLGVEMLANPTLLFLDEATSGLDAGIEARMMALFRKLADEGRSVVCVTHNLDNVCLCNLVAILIRGRLAYYGPPDELPGYFKVDKISQVYDRLETATPAEWAANYAASPLYEKYVASRLRDGQTGSQNAVQQFSYNSKSNGVLHQLFVLTHRYLSVAFLDLRNILILLGQAPIIAGMLGLVFRGVNFSDPALGPIDQKMLSFLLVVSAIWFGCINAAREIVKELPLYLRERAIGLSLVSYLGSKIAVLSLLCVIQCATLLFITLAATKFRPDITIELGDLVLTSFGGMIMGLLISASVEEENKAMSLIPILLIPQVIFAGVIISLSGLAAYIAKFMVIAYWSMDAQVHSLNTAARRAIGTHHTLGMDFAIMTVFLVGLTFVTAFVLKQKDPLK